VSSATQVSRHRVGAAGEPRATSTPPPALRDGVRLLCRDPRATTAREGRALPRYCDYLSQLAKVDEAVRNRIGSGEFRR